MRAFENSKQNNGRSTTSCGYCRQQGHSIGSCPHIQYDYDEWSAYRVPHQSSTINHCHWFMNDYSYWIKQIDRYYPKFLAAQERKKNPTTRQRSAPKCGFCGDPNHNRRNCSELVSFAKRLKQANSNWRQAVYDKLVTELGLGIGSVVKVVERSPSWQGRLGCNEPVIGMIGVFDLSKCNMFCVNTSINSDYRQGIEVEVLINGSPCRMRFPSTTSPSAPLQDDKGRGALVRGDGYYYGAVNYQSTVARSELPLDESWVSTGAMEDEFNWLLKKRSLEWLTDNGVVRQVETWEGE